MKFQTIKEIKKGCGNRGFYYIDKHHEDRRLTFCGTLLYNPDDLECGENNFKWLCPSCQALLKQAEAFLQMIESRIDLIKSVAKEVDNIERNLCKLKMTELEKLKQEVKG